MITTSPIAKRVRPPAGSTPLSAAESRPDFSALERRGTRSGWAMRAIYLVSDLTAFVAAVALAAWGMNAVFQWGIAWAGARELRIAALLVGGLLVVSAAQGTYAAIPPRPVRKFRGWVLAAVGVCAAVIAATWLLDSGLLARDLALVLGTTLAVLLASFCRAICRIVFGSASWWGTRLIVVGSGNLAHKIHRELEREPQWGLRAVGVVDISPDDLAGAPHLRNIAARLDALAAEYAVNRALVAIDAHGDENVAALLSRTSGNIVHWIVLPPLERFPSMWLEACEAARLPALAFTNRLAIPWSAAFKRAFDLAACFCLGIAALPLVVAIAVLIRLGSPGPIFYGQERIGRGGRRFTAWKFRTMLLDADAVLTRYLRKYPELAAEWDANHKLRDDPRITRVGHWLRSSSLDELPQLWNVLLGEMSLVGPRPIVAAEIEKYAESYAQYVTVLPGLTGLWQVSGRNNTTYEERVELDVYYIHNWSLWLDIYILACTAKVVVLREGAY
jgi:Undecaprenyl-phosphate galactose phosphotransferase WbaP